MSGFDFSPFVAIAHDARPELCAPLRIGAHVYACDGILSIRVLAKAEHAEVAEASVWAQRALPHLFEQFPYRQGEPLPERAPPRALPACGACVGTGQTVRFGDCNVASNSPTAHQHPGLERETCTLCRGLGSNQHGLIELDRRCNEVGVGLTWLNYWRISTLPNVWIDTHEVTFFDGAALTPGAIPFIFDGGEGRVAPRTL